MQITDLPMARFRGTKVKVLIFFVNNLLKFTDEDKLMNNLIESPDRVPGEIDV